MWTSRKRLVARGVICRSMEVGGAAEVLSAEGRSVASLAGTQGAKGLVFWRFDENGWRRRKR